MIQAAAPRLGAGVATGIGAVPFRAVRGAVPAQADFHPLPSSPEVVVDAAERWACDSHAIKEGRGQLRSVAANRRLITTRQRWVGTGGRYLSGQSSANRS